jgi:hypothetical protein
VSGLIKREKIYTSHGTVDIVRFQPREMFGLHQERERPSPAQRQAAARSRASPEWTYYISDNQALDVSTQYAMESGLQL